MTDPVPLNYQQPMQPRPGWNPHVGWILLCLVLGALLVWFLQTPSFVHSGSTRDRTKCANNLRQIGLAITMYCNENKGQYPPDLVQLAAAEQLTAEVFVCPGWSRWTPAGQPAAAGPAGTMCRYVYIGAGMTERTAANQVIAFELPENHEKDDSEPGGFVLYGDVHVEWHPLAELVQVVPELEAGHNPPVFQPISSRETRKLYEQVWLPKLASIKAGTWAASLQRPATRPSHGGRDDE